LGRFHEEMGPLRTISVFAFRVRVDGAGVVCGEKKIGGGLEGNKTTKATKSTKGRAAGGSSSEEIGEAT